MIDKISLSREALRKASTIRKRCKVGRLDPICIYDLVEKCGVEVKFQAINSMEGMYVKNKQPTIVVASERPAGRQVYTCAHEYGHHVFGHGSKIDEKIDSNASNDKILSEEFIVDCFAGHLLMPRHAITNAFTVRNWDIGTCTPYEIYVIAGQLGVAYGAIINHMNRSLQLINATHANQLTKHSPKKIRESILNSNSTAPRLQIVDRHWNSKVAVDLQVGEQAILPSRVLIENNVVKKIDNHELGVLVEACKSGTVKSWLPCSVPASNGTVRDG